MLFAVFFCKSHNNFKESLEVQNSETSLVDQRGFERFLERLGFNNTFKVEAGKQEKIEEEVYNEVPLPEYEFTEEEIYMLAQCVEAEAGKYQYAPDGQKYVTQVILNRLHSSSFPDTLKEVIYQKNGNVPQFSVAYNGMMDIVPEPETFNSVYDVIVHGTDMPEYVLFFYADHVKNNWVNTLNVWNTIDGTVFAYK